MGSSTPKIRLFKDGTLDDVTGDLERFFNTQKPLTNIGKTSRNLGQTTVLSTRRNTSSTTECEGHHSSILNASSRSTGSATTTRNSRVNTPEILKSVTAKLSDTVAHIQDDIVEVTDELYELSDLDTRLEAFTSPSPVHAEVAEEHQKRLKDVADVNNPSSNVMQQQKGDNSGMYRAYMREQDINDLHNTCFDKSMKSFQNMIRKVKNTRMLALASTLKVQNTHVTWLLETAAASDDHSPAQQETVRNILFDSDTFLDTINKLTVKSKPVLDDNPHVDNYLNCRFLSEMYNNHRKTIPDWFYRLFRCGKLRIPLEPTFPDAICTASIEYLDMKNARFSITLNIPTDRTKTEDNSGESGPDIAVAEKISFSEHVDASGKTPETDSDCWRRNYQYRVAVRKEGLNARRVELHGSRGDVNVDYTKGKYTREAHQKTFILVFLQGSDGIVCGIYRREMSSENGKFLTWRFRILT